MTRSEETLAQLENAMARILAGKPKRISVHRKLSIRAVEEEAGLGNGSCHYYSDFCDRIRDEKKLRSITSGECSKTKASYETLREKLANEKRIKNKYRVQNKELQETIQRLAAEHHHFNDLLRRNENKNRELEKENNELALLLDKASDEIVSLKREMIIKLNR